MCYHIVSSIPDGIKLSVLMLDWSVMFTSSVSMTLSRLFIEFLKTNYIDVSIVYTPYNSNYIDIIESQMC